MQAEIKLGSREARVLVVEDDPVSALLVRKLLESQGIASDHARDGAEATELFKRRSHRLVISDWMMPNMSGLDLCRQFREVAEPYVYFILCSAKGDRADRTEAFEAGVDDFLTKPLDRMELYSRLKVAKRILSTEDNLQRQKLELEKAGEKLTMMNVNLTMASQRFEELFNGLPVACFTFDQDGNIHEWNRCAEEVFGLKSHEAFQQPVWDLLSRNDEGDWSTARVNEIFASPGPTSFDWELRRTPSDARHFACNIFGMRSNTGEITGAISANLDITERKLAENRIDQQILQINEFTHLLEMQKAQLVEANIRLEHLADTDGLTGLLNHRRFQEDLERQFGDRRRTSTPLSLVLLDVDHFKAYNDNFGHQAGDEVLKQFAHILKSTCRANETVARYGGEEFAIILDGCDSETANATAERFRIAVEKGQWNLRPVTASFGVASAGPQADSPFDLIKQSDAALYAAKLGGRNRVTHFRDSGPKLESDVDETRDSSAA